MRNTLWSFELGVNSDWTSESTSQKWRDRDEKESGTGGIRPVAGVNFILRLSVFAQQPGGEDQSGGEEAFFPCLVILTTLHHPVE